MAPDNCSDPIGVSTILFGLEKPAAQTSAAQLPGGLDVIWGLGNQQEHVRSSAQGKANVPIVPLCRRASRIMSIFGIDLCRRTEHQTRSATEGLATPLPFLLLP